MTESHTTLLESVPCVLCGVHEAEHQHQAEGLNYVRCKRCGLVYVNPRPRPEAVQAVYEKSKPMAWFKKFTYRRRRMAGFKNLAGRLQRGEMLVHEVEQYKTGGRIMDVGCNRGFILAAAAARGWDAHGVEIVPWVTQMVEREFDVTIYNRRLRDIAPPLPDRHFDAITMIDIIEHLHEPVEDLREIHRILKDDGFLLINTVDIASAYARITGPAWSMMKPQEHLFLFDRQTLSAMLDRTGFSVICINPSKGGPGEFEAHIRKKPISGIVA